jgi:hypothetical protein
MRRATPRLSRTLRRLARWATSRWTRTAILVVAVAISVWSIDRVPEASLLPAVLGLLPWAVGKYLLCPLRWHALSSSGQRRWWHIRVYAESELLGMLSPGHAGADLWRVHRLHQTGRSRPAAAAEVGLDRLVGAVGLAAGVALTGAALPWRVIVALVAVAALAVGIALAVRAYRPALFAERPLPRAGALVRGLLLSLGYQATIVGLVFGAVTAVGHSVDPFALLAVFGASQVAGIVPGMHGASPRDGALAVGLTALGVSWQAAIGAVALVTLLPWAPAFLLGGGSFAARRLAMLRARVSPA